MRVHSRFRLPSAEVITGRFTGDEVLANMTGSTVAGRGEARETHDLANIISKEQVTLAQMAQQQE